MDKSLIYPAFATILSLSVYFSTIANVGRMRYITGIQAPATTGHPDFERAFRLQQNTMEQLVLFLPVLWLFAMFINPQWSLVVGLLWVIGRIVYAVGYTFSSFTLRAIGFVTGVLTAFVPLIWSLVKIIALFVSA
jgi:uncharacterized membrane protein YecN with MAPEG domain